MGEHLYGITRTDRYNGSSLEYGMKPTTRDDAERKAAALNLDFPELHYTVHPVATPPECADCKASPCDCGEAIWRAWWTPDSGNTGVWSQEHRQVGARREIVDLVEGGSPSQLGTYEVRRYRPAEEAKPVLTTLTRDAYEYRVRIPYGDLGRAKPIQLVAPDVTALARAIFFSDSRVIAILARVNNERMVPSAHGTTARCGRDAYTVSDYRDRAWEHERGIREECIARAQACVEEWQR